MIDTPAAPPRQVRRWPWRVAVLFIVATLIALVIVPYVVNQRVERLRDAIRTADPARTMVMRWHYQLTREVVALSEMLLTGDHAPLADYVAEYDAERATVRELELLANQLGPPVNTAYVNARMLAHQWHARIDTSQIRIQLLPGASLMQIPKERQLVNDVMRAVSSVDAAIIRASDRTRIRIFAAERDGIRLSLLLGVLVLIAGAGVITLEARMRRFAEEAEARRADAAAALAESARVTDARERLLRGITHDVKNPLGAAKGYAELLEMGAKAPLAPEQAPLVEGIVRSVDNALTIIADLLDLARADSGGMNVERVECDVTDVVRDAAADHDAAARAAGHTLHAEVPDEPLHAHTDPIRVRQVLDNLISNAIKFTPAPGRITVRVGTEHETAAAADTSRTHGRREADAAATVKRTGMWVTIEVSDTGPGIPRDKREAVFEEFARLEGDKSKEGHGLGLAIARGLARRLGGDLTIADSEIGATFVLRIPQRSHEHEHEHTASDAAHHPSGHAT